MPTPRKTEGDPVRAVEEGREVLIYDDGTKKDAQTGRFLRGPDDTPISRDPAGMARRGIALSRARAREAIDLETGVDPSQRGTDEGWMLLVRHAVGLVRASTSPRGVAELLKVIGTAAGYLTREDREQLPLAGTISATPEKLVALIALLDEELERRTAKARAVDGEVR